MKLPVRDIPAEGRKFSFPLSLDALNGRVNAVRKENGTRSVLPPQYTFTAAPEVQVEVYSRGDTVFFSGLWTATYETICSRCSEDLARELSGKTKVVLKSIESAENPAQAFDDVDFSYYRGDEIDLAEIIVEDVMLHIPYIDVCEGDAQAACDERVRSLSSEPVEETQAGDERLALFRTLKVEDLQQK